MGKRTANIPLAHNWVCEGCRCCYEGVNPPAECSFCGHEYFENLQDLVDEAEDTKAAA